MSHSGCMPCLGLLLSLAHPLILLRNILSLASLQDADPDSVVKFVAPVSLVSPLYCKHPGGRFGTS